MNEWANSFIDDAYAAKLITSLHQFQTTKKTKARLRLSTNYARLELIPPNDIIHILLSLPLRLLWI
jgi:hypothetical protein